MIGNHFGNSNHDLFVSCAADHNAIIAAQERQILRDAINIIVESPFVETGKVNTPPATSVSTEPNLNKYGTKGWSKWCRPFYRV